MDALARRDAIFSRLHASYLKPLGYKKTGAWSRLSAAPFHWGVYLRSSRWNVRNHVTFWIDLCVLHEDFAKLFYGRTATQLTEAAPAMVHIELGRLLNPVVPQWEIEESTNVDVLETRLCEAFQSKGLPLLKQCNSLEGVLTFFKSHPAGWTPVAPLAAGVYILLERRNEAIAALNDAKAAARNEQGRAWIEGLESKMLANSALQRTRQKRRAVERGR
jgi:hypothetical protein